MLAAIALLGILTQFVPFVSNGVAAAAEPSPRPQSARKAKASKAPTPAPTPRPAPAHRIRPSEVHGTPLPKPSPKPPRARGVRSQPKAKPSTVVITPAPPAPPKRSTLPPAAFQLTQNGPGKLTLKFQSSNPDLKFDARAPFVIEFNTLDPFKVEPSIITRENWPKGATQIPLTYSGQRPGQDNAILGKAAFTVCTARSKECRAVKVPIELHIK